MNNRAYSWIDVKAFDDAKRTIEGIATTPTPDRGNDIVNPLGAKFSLPIPFLWQHDHSAPVGHVIDADAKSSGIRFKAKIESIDEPGRLKDMLDFAWQSLKLRLVRATSIGFRPLKYSFIDNGGVDFEEWEWYELSAVTIPMQADATIDNVKSIDAALRRAAGLPELEIPLAPIAAASGKSLPVVKLDAPVRDRTTPFVIRKIRTD